MRRHIMLLLCLCGALASHDACAYDPPLTGAYPTDSAGSDAFGLMMASVIGSVSPQYGGGIVVFGGLMGAADATSDKQTILYTSMAAIGVYDRYAGHHGTSGGRIFAVNSAVLMGTWIYVDGRHGASAASAVPHQGFYLAPLPTERGAVIGYHWIF